MGTVHYNSAAVLHIACTWKSLLWSVLQKLEKILFYSCSSHKSDLKSKPDLVLSFHGLRVADQMPELFADIFICTLETTLTIQWTQLINFV